MAILYHFQTMSYQAICTFVVCYITDYYKKVRKTGIILLLMIYHHHHHHHHHRSPNLKWSLGWYIFFMCILSRNNLADPIISKPDHCQIPPSRWLTLIVNTTTLNYKFSFFSACCHSVQLLTYS